MEFGLILIIIIIVIGVSGIKIVPQSKAYVIERLGAYHRTLQTGLNYVIPFFERVANVVNLKEIVKDLGADSLDVVEMLMGLEEEFNITVPEEDAVNIKTVGDIVKLIEEKQ